MLFLSLAQSRGLQPGASATFFRLLPPVPLTPEAPPTPAGAVNADVDGGAASPPLRGGANEEGGAISVLDDGGRGATDCKSVAALEGFEVELAVLSVDVLCL